MLLLYLLILGILSPTLLEWVANIRLNRMALGVNFIDETDKTIEVTSHSSTEDFASAAVRTKFPVSTDIPPQLLYTGWSVALCYEESEQIELWPEAKVLDLVSHIELPMELQPRTRFPGLGIIGTVPAVVSLNKKTDLLGNPNLSGNASGYFAQISKQNQTGKTKANGPRITSTPKVSALGEQV